MCLTRWVSIFRVVPVTWKEGAHKYSTPPLTVISTTFLSARRLHFLQSAWAAGLSWAQRLTHQFLFFLLRCPVALEALHLGKGAAASPSSKFSSCGPFIQSFLPLLNRVSQGLFVLVFVLWLRLLWLSTFSLSLAFGLGFPWASLGLAAFGLGLPASSPSLLTKSSFSCGVFGAFSSSSMLQAALKSKSSHNLCLKHNTIEICHSEWKSFIDKQCLSTTASCHYPYNIISMT